MSFKVGVVRLLNELLCNPCAEVLNTHSAVAQALCLISQVITWNYLIECIDDQYFLCSYEQSV